jgi:hypothetical protein
VSVNAQRRRVVIDVQVGGVRFRRALADALNRAVAGEPGGPWRIRLGPGAPLGHEGHAPPFRHWWWSVRLTGADGRPHALLVGPQNQNPPYLEVLVRNALQVECLSVCDTGVLRHGSAGAPEKAKSLREAIACF